MNQKKKRGFTLIELLAVIVILAIIALIAVPVIMNIISKANESAFKDTAYGVIQAGELYFAEQLLEPNGMTSDVTITLPDTTKKLQIKGDVPTGSILITTEGKVAIAVHNNRYCVTKGILDDDITVTEDIANCNLPSEEVNPEEGGGNTPQVGSIKTLATTSAEVTNIPACVTNGTECTPGTPVAIQVNENEVYNFYVINDENNEVTLIMDRNLGENVAWYADDFDSTRGPITAIAALKTRTSGWSNIPEREYTYSDDGANLYESISETMRARMLTYTEATNEKIKCTYNSGSCPEWLYKNLNGTGDANTNGFWLSATFTDDTYNALIVYLDGDINILYVTKSDQCGIRPVITLTK